MSALILTRIDTIRSNLLGISIGMIFGVLTSIIVSKCMVGRSTNNYGDLVLSAILLIVVFIVGVCAFLYYKDYSQILASNIGTGLITSLILSSSDAVNRVYYDIGLVIFGAVLLITAILFIYPRIAFKPQ